MVSKKKTAKNSTKQQKNTHKKKLDKTSKKVEDMSTPIDEESRKKKLRVNCDYCYRWRDKNRKTDLQFEQVCTVCCLCILFCFFFLFFFGLQKKNK